MRFTVLRFYGILRNLRISEATVQPYKRSDLTTTNQEVNTHIIDILESENHQILRLLAERYEKKEFLDGDPSWFMHQVEDASDKELLAFIASALSYGSRKQFMPKIQFILDSSKGRVREWLVNGDYATTVPPSSDCYYRLYTYSMMNDFLKALATMINEYGTMRQFAEDVGSDDTLDIIKAITTWFKTHGSRGIIPKDAKSSCKRICMFLRWMVREDSPVDIGLWSDIIDRRTLIMPLDTHVLQQAIRLKMIQTKSASMATAQKLTDKMREIWQDDPLKGDFALFGYGVNNAGQRL